uniref:Uncharacterized protein n=1 Tax=Oryza punctata TaxID=4537 RepID=A0A0E0MLU6_ORYPU
MDAPGRPTGGPMVDDSHATLETLEAPGKGKDPAVTPDLAAKKKKPMGSSGSPGTPRVMTRAAVATAMALGVMGAPAKTMPLVRLRDRGSWFARFGGPPGQATATQARLGALGGASGPEAAGRTTGDLGKPGVDARARMAGDASGQGADGGVVGGGDDAAVPPHHRPGKEPVDEDEENMEEIMCQPHALPSTHYVSPRQAAWFEGGKAEKDAMKMRFDDAADKADSTAMLPTVWCSWVAVRHAVKIVDCSTAKSEMLWSVFDNITKIEKIQRARVNFQWQKEAKVGQHREKELWGQLRKDKDEWERSKCEATEWKKLVDQAEAAGGQAQIVDL